MANANWSNPTTTSLYTNVISEIKNRDEDLALQFDGTTSTNILTNTIRWDSTANRWKKWNGTAWAELASTYALTGLSLTGNASITGTLGVTSTSTFTGAATFNNATSPIISAKIGPAAAQQHVLPAVTSDTVTLIAATQTLTNKTLTSPTVNGATLSGTIAGDHTRSGQNTFSNATAPIISAKLGPSSTQQHTLPAVTSDTVALLAATQTFSNKTLAAPTVSGLLTLSDTGAAKLNSGTIAQRPASPTAGMFRFNSETNSFEGYNGTAWGSVGGASGAAGNSVFYENDQTVTSSYTITTNKNASSVGPISINSGVTVTIPSGSVWAIIGV